MYTRLAIAVGFVCCVSILALHNHTVFAEEAASTDAKSDTIYCESGQQILVLIDVADGGNGIKATPYASVADRGYKSGNPPPKAKTCSVVVCPHNAKKVTRGTKPQSRGQSSAVSGTYYQYGDGKFLTADNVTKKKDEGTNRGKDTCTPKKPDEPKDKDGCYEKCVQHDDPINLQEVKSEGLQTIEDAQKENAGELRKSLDEAKKAVGGNSGQIQLGGSLPAKLNDQALRDNRLSEILAANSTSESEKAVIQANIDKNKALIERIENNSGYLSSYVPMDNKFIQEQLDRKIPSAADSVRVTSDGKPLGPESLGGRVDTMCNVYGKGYVPCAIPAETAGLPAYVTGNLNTFVAPPKNDPDPGPGPRNDIPQPVPGPAADTSFSKSLSSFLSGFGQGLGSGLSGMTSPYSSYSQYAQQQQQYYSSYCQNQLGSSAQYISSTNQCVCPTNAPLTNGKCTQLSVSASLSCAPKTVDNGRSALISWSCGGATTADGVGFETNNQTSGKVEPRINESAGVKTKTYSLSCINGEVKTNKSCTVNVNRPSLVMTMSGSPETSQYLTMGFSSFGTRSCTTLSPDIASINNQTSSVAEGSMSGVGGVRKVAVEDLKQKTRIVVSCETLGNNTLAGGFVITKEPFSVRRVDPQLIAESAQVSEANYYTTGSGSTQTSQSYQTASASGDTWGTTGGGVECNPDDSVGVFTTCLLKI